MCDEGSDLTTSIRLRHSVRRLPSPKGEGQVIRTSKGEENFLHPYHRSRADPLVISLFFVASSVPWFPARLICDLDRSRLTYPGIQPPIIGVDPAKLDFRAQQFEFSSADNPITVPQDPGNYKLVWRLWQCGRYVDPPIILEINVVSQ